MDIDRILTDVLRSIYPDVYSPTSYNVTMFLLVLAFAMLLWLVIDSVIVKIDWMFLTEGIKGMICVGIVILLVAEGELRFRGAAEREYLKRLKKEPETLFMVKNLKDSLEQCGKIIAEKRK